LLCLAKITIKERVVDGFSVIQCYNAQISRSIFGYRNFAPEANAAVRLDLAPDRGGEYVQAPLRWIYGRLRSTCSSK
jgi:hypothetical protein